MKRLFFCSLLFIAGYVYSLDIKSNNNGDISDVNAGSNVSVTNPGGPSPTVAINSTSTARIADVPQLHLSTANLQAQIDRKVSTFTFIATAISSAGARISTMPFVAIPGLSWTTGRSTWNATAVRFSVIDKSTVGSSFLKIAESTGTAGSEITTPLFSYVTPLVEITTGSNYSNWTSTGHAYYPDKFFSVHLTTSPESGLKLGLIQVEIEHWRAPY